MVYWLNALLTSVVSGVCNAVLAYFVIPDLIKDAKTSFINLGWMALGGLIIGIVNWLRTSPWQKPTS